METPQQTIVRVDWKAAQAKLKGKISSEDEQIVELLAVGRSTPDIAKALGTNRSAVWRRIQKVKQFLADKP